MKNHSVRSSRSGFTLLEVVISVMLMAIIIGMVVSIARTSLALGNTIVKTQNEEMAHQAFFELLSQRFSSLPGNTRFNLKVEDSGNHYLSDMTLQNVPMSFTWGSEDRVAKAVQLSTVKRRSGYLDIVLRYYEEEILEGSESKMGKSSETKPFAEIVLLEDVAYFEWRVLDGRSMEWQYDWDVQGRMPLQIELTMAIGANGKQIRQIFWVPPKQNPEVVMRQLTQGGGNGQPGGGNGQPGGQPIIIPSPGGGPSGEIVPPP
ncbi:MAG: prepilin-type N-terminal cleavage/methylation domain-containing protein [Gloeobacteraceae cyanobacterium ES-bin-144]|nr:prepilin-type N-terminal cleavage/methylation domain-containing protein [Verrucomicrobiales bacterium]